MVMLDSQEVQKHQNLRVVRGKIFNSPSLVSFVVRGHKAELIASRELAAQEQRRSRLAPPAVAAHSCRLVTLVWT